MTKCKMCEGDGTIHENTTGRSYPCTRCFGTGKEPENVIYLDARMPAEIPFQELAELTKLRSEVKRLRDALAGVLWATNMKLIKGSHSGWYCPLCRAEHRNLAELEAGLHHKLDCTYAEGRAVLNGTKTE